MFSPVLSTKLSLCFRIKEAAERKKKSPGKKTPSKPGTLGGGGDGDDGGDPYGADTDEDEKPCESPIPHL